MRKAVKLYLPLWPGLESTITVNCDHQFLKSFLSLIPPLYLGHVILIPKGFLPTKALELLLLELELFSTLFLDSKIIEKSESCFNTSVWYWYEVSKSIFLSLSSTSILYVS